MPRSVLVFGFTLARADEESEVVAVVGDVGPPTACTVLDGAQQGVVGGDEATPSGEVAQRAVPEGESGRDGEAGRDVGERDEAQGNGAAWFMREAVLEPLLEAVNPPAQTRAGKREGLTGLCAVVSPGGEELWQGGVCSQFFVAVASDVPLEEGGDVVVVEVAVDAGCVAELEELSHFVAVPSVGGVVDASAARDTNLTAKTGELSAGELQWHCLTAGSTATSSGR